MKIVGITMVTNPDYREDPWQQCIAQMLEVVDIAVVICGRAQDVEQINTWFTPEVKEGRLEATYLHWPQPEWSYDELPRHLNAALDIARMYDPDWVIKFDIDNFIHENDIPTLRAELSRASHLKKQAASIEKYQFHRVFKCFEKGKIPICLNMRSGNRIVYGKDNRKYNDLCQPIIPDKGSFRPHPTAYDTPTGYGLEEKDIYPISGVHVWNYDYSFKTEKKSRELLYYFDRSHALFWQSSYKHRSLDELNEQVAFDDHMQSAVSRAAKANIDMPYDKHPKHIKNQVKLISPDQFGYNLWNYPTL